MEYLDWSPEGVAEGLSQEDALLETCGRTGSDALAVWIPRGLSVVVGRSNRGFGEVDLESCRRLGIPVLRRRSGGGTVLIGPGCLNYALVFRPRHVSPLEGISRTNREVMERLRAAASRASGQPVRIEGHTDLAISGRKFSGNSQYRGPSGILFHGTMMLDLDVGLVERVMALPRKAPPYRRGRTHRDFLMNLGVDGEVLKAALREVWGAGPIPGQVGTTPWRRA